MEQHTIKKCIAFGTACFWVLLSKLVFLNWIWGSNFASFSLASATAPVVGLNAGILAVFLYCLDFRLLSWNAPFFLLYRAPLFLSAFAFRRLALLTYCGLPLLAMGLFIFHPTGQNVYWYTFYWFIPMIIYVMQWNSLFARSLAATFVAHAAGSVIWLYCGAIPAATWASLVPLVPLERLTFACVTVVCYSVWSWSTEKIVRLVEGRSAPLPAFDN